MYIKIVSVSIQWIYTKTSVPHPHALTYHSNILYIPCHEPLLTVFIFSCKQATNRRNGLEREKKRERERGGRERERERERERREREREREGGGR